MIESFSNSLRSWLGLLALMVLCIILSPDVLFYFFNRFYLNKYWLPDTVFKLRDSCDSTVIESFSHPTQGATFHRSNFNDNFSANVLGDRTSSLPSFQTNIASENISKNYISTNQQCTAHPSCMKKWISKDLSTIEKHFLRFGYLSKQKKYRGSGSREMKGAPIDNTSDHSTTSVLRRGFVSVGKSDNLLQHLHHIPHFSEAYFNFFSLAIWSCEFSNRVEDEDRRRHIDSSNHLLLYPQQINATNKELIDVTVIIDKLLIHNSSRQFWSMRLDSASHYWIKQIVMIVDDILGTKTIISSSCSEHRANRNIERNERTQIMLNVRGQSKERDRRYDYLSLPITVDSWFLHSSDALSLGSFILNEDPCKYKGILKRQHQLQKYTHLLENNNHENYSTDSTKIKKSNLAMNDKHKKHFAAFLKVGILNRKKDRKLFNAVDVLNSPLIRNKSMITSQFILDDKSLVEQVSLIRTLDILIAVHGAGLTNMAWLKPCSIVFEVFPYGYYIPTYFGPLASKIGLIHYTLESTLYDTIITNLLLERPHCHKRMSRLQNTVKNQIKEIDKEAGVENISIISPLSYSNLCFEDDLCRSCSRGADGVRVNISLLDKLLSKLLIDRAECILNHDFL